MEPLACRSRVDGGQMRIDQIEAGKTTDVSALAAKGGTVAKLPLKSSVEDFYLTNPVARASAVMAEC